MLKVAMLNEADARRAVCSNDPSIIEEVMEGGARLREAAQDGRQQLQATMDDVLAILQEKKFSNASLDKQTTPSKGGLHVSGAITGSRGARPPLPRDASAHQPKESGMGRASTGAAFPREQISYAPIVEG